MPIVIVSGSCVEEGILTVEVEVIFFHLSEN